ncbi:MAG: universal stress protein [Methanomicrobiales archaeon]|nr:universal stress protein [Methanomicrobiales archaeon]
MKILVLLDGSKWSQKAAMHAITIAKRKKAQVMFFSVLDIREAKAMAFNFCAQSDLCDRIKNYEEQIWRDMKKSINDEIADILYYYNRENVDCLSKVVEGNLHEEIVREVKDGGYTLIVMGAYGKNAKIRMGSLFCDISRDVTAPILIVH